MDDYIRREAAKAQIRKAYTRIEDRVAINCVINDVPAADVAPVRHGRWIEAEQPCGWCEEVCAECSVCGEDFVLGEYSMADLKSLFRYCPNCGAKMDGGADDGE